MLNRLKTLGQRGDTIVEVMIVMAILSLAISISYATANRSLLNARQAQENSEATALIQSQVEALRTLAPNGSSAPSIYVPQPFCTTPAPPSPPLPRGYTVVLLSDPAAATACNPNPGGAVPYAISIQFCGSSSAPACLNHTDDDTFIVTASWDNVRGEGKDTVSLTYRLHKPAGAP